MLSNSFDFLITVFFIFGGCCTNVFFLEHLFKDVTSANLLLTFSQFFFVTFVGVLRGHFRNNQVPLSRWAIQGCLLLFVNNLNHLALGYEVPMPIHILFRSSGIIMTMALSVILLKRSYPLLSYVSIATITLGVMITTTGSITTTSYSSPISLGLLFLILSLVFSAFLGLYQEETYMKYPGDWQCGLFYSHLLALPCFLIVASPLSNEIQHFSSGPQIFGLGVSDLWLLLLLITATQYICIASVHKLASVSTSLTTTLLLTLRKCISLTISVFYFKNEFNFRHYMGAFLVLSGTLLYAQSMKRPKLKKA